MFNKWKEIFSEVVDVSYIVYKINNTELINSWGSCEIKAADVSLSFLSAFAGQQGFPAVLGTSLCLSWFCPTDPWEWQHTVPDSPARAYKYKGEPFGIISWERSVLGLIW